MQADDGRLSRYVAIKISVSELWHDDHEAQILNRLSQGPASHPGKRHIVQLLDRFAHVGPNGSHRCLVLELLGSNAQSEGESYSSNRLPGSIAGKASKQVSQALAYIHASGIAHGGKI